MKKIKLNTTCFGIACLLLCLLSFKAGAQQNADSLYKKYGRCGLGQASHHHHLDTIKENYVLDKNNTIPEDSIVYIIPVVFHVYYSSIFTGPGKMPERLFQEQIDIMNEDYRKKKGTLGYSDLPVSDDAGIQFCLAKLDPYGNPTTGILKYQKFAYSNITTNDGGNELEAKSFSVWDQDRYLNIWVVDKIDGADKTGGFSYLPTQIFEISGLRAYDGIVLNYRLLGRTNPDAIANYTNGRTSTHEAGHFFNLKHPWGGDQAGQGGCGDDDGVDDTPDCENWYHATVPDCNHPLQCGNYRLIEDYMDYSDDRCMHLFTKGQVKRMRSAIRKYRPKMATCENALRASCISECAKTPYAVVEAPSVKFVMNPTDNTLRIYTKFLDLTSLNLVIYDNTGRLVYSASKIPLLEGFKDISLPVLSPGIYYVFADNNKEIWKGKFAVMHSN